MFRETSAVMDPLGKLNEQWPDNNSQLLPYAATHEQQAGAAKADVARGQFKVT